jgi:rhodanese-related sulfurtransferase
MSRTITAEELKARRREVHLIDVRRKDDFDQEPVTAAGAAWRDPTRIDEWRDGLPRDREVVLYCVRGGSVSNSVLDALLAHGLAARYIEGGFEAWKAAGGEVARP